MNPLKPIQPKSNETVIARHCNDQSISCGHGLLKALQPLKTSSTMFKFVNSVVWYSMPPGDSLPVTDTINGTENWHLLSQLYICFPKFDNLVKLVTIDGF